MVAEIVSSKIRRESGCIPLIFPVAHISNILHSLSKTVHINLPIPLQNAASDQGLHFVL